MIRNLAGQVIGVQMTNATTGADFTGVVTVYITGDAGLQALGTVGAGVCTHEGKGLHTYAPSQAETDYLHIAFTFQGTGAITATVQLYTDTAATPADVLAQLVTYGALTPTVPGRTLNVDAGGDVDANVVGGTLAAMEAFADAFLNRDWTLVSDTNARTLLNAARYLRNKRAIALGTLEVTKENDTTTAWTAATIGTPGAPPISSVDPA